MIDPADVLRAFAELTTTDHAPASSAADQVIWLGGTFDRDLQPLRPVIDPYRGSGTVSVDTTVDHVVLPGGHSTAPGEIFNDFVTRARQFSNGFLEAGWCWVVGRDSAGTQVCRPLVRRRATFRHTALLGAPALHWADPDWWLDLGPAGSALQTKLTSSLPLAPFITPVVEPRIFRRMTALRSWARSAALAAGYEPTEITTAHPVEHADDDGVVVCVGFGLWLSNVAAAIPTDTSAGSLLAWSTTKGIDHTSFAALMTDNTVTPAPATDTADPIRSPLALDSSQRRVLGAVRDRPIVAVSGPPGTGKSHTVVALAMDAVGRGHSVLVATRSIEAANVLTEQFSNQPGPVPIRFGSREARESSLAEIERRLADHQPAAMAQLAAEAAATYGRLLADITERLDRVRLAHRYRDLEATIAELAHQLPRCFDDDADLDEMARLAGFAAPDGHGLAGSWHHRSALHQLSDAVGCDAEPMLVNQAIEAARARHAVANLAGCEGELQGLWDKLEYADRDHRHWLGRQLDESVLSRAEGSDGRTALSTVRAALLSGERTRRQVMGTLDPSHLALAAPLWLGTLGDIDALLPHQPGLFDLVVIDEAAQVDQALAAPALLRAKRAAIFGDPRQLAHTSFVSDTNQSAALAAHGLDDAGARFDLRRTSQLDAAAIASPVIWLSEHHRSVPHLIGFSLSRFYDREVTLATRHPSNETLIAIDVVRTENHTPDAVAEVVRDLVRTGATSVGVISPFRETAEAIDTAVRTALSPAELEAAHVRVGTVHSFQGSERDVMVVAPDLAAADAGTRRRFVEDPHLFNVMVTRARSRMVVVVPTGPQPAGLLSDLLAWADVPPPAEPIHDPTSPDAAGVAEVLADSGLTARTGYPVGNWSVDVCVGTDKRAAGVMVGCHPDGPGAHVDRHLALRRSGWRLIDPVVVDDDTDGGATVRGLELLRALNPTAQAGRSSRAAAANTPLTNRPESSVE